MKNPTKPLLLAVCGTSLFFNFIGCKKESVESTTQQSNAQHSIASHSQIPMKDYSILLSTAIDYTKRYRALKEKKAPISYQLPIDGLRQLIGRVEASGLRSSVKWVTLYMGIKPDGSNTAVYVATKEDGVDVLEFPNETQTNNFNAPRGAAGDETHDCPGTCIFTPNELNN